MHMAASKGWFWGVVLGSAALIAGCAGTPETPSNSSVSAQVPLTATSDPNVFTYVAPDLKAAGYRGFLIDPVTIYDGSDADFGGASSDDKKQLAALLGKEFSRVLGERYAIVTAPGPGIVRLELTLVGINESRPLLSTALRLTPVGLGVTALRSAAGKPANFVGSVTIAGLAMDSASGKILGGAEAQISPPAYNLTSGLGMQRAAELGVTRGAEQFRSYVDGVTGQR